MRNETSTPTNPKTDIPRSLVEAARKVDIPSLLLFANAFVLQQQRQQQQPYFVPATRAEGELQQQLLQCRERLLRLLQQSAATAAAGAAVAVAIAGNSYYDKDSRALIFNETTAETWNDLLQDLRTLLSLLNTMLQSQQCPLPETAAAAVERLLEDINTALHYSRNRKRENRRNFQDWQQYRGGQSSQGHPSWLQQQRVQQQHHQRQQMHLVQAEIKAIAEQLAKWQHTGKVDTHRSGETSLPDNASKNETASPAATNISIVDSLSRQRSTEEDSDPSSDASSLSKSNHSINSSDTNSSDSKNSSNASSNSSKNSARSEDSSKITSSSNSSSNRSSSNNSKASSRSSSKSSSSSSGSDSENNKTADPVDAPSGAAGAAPALAPRESPVSLTVHAGEKHQHRSSDS
ncbi:hypothetical protein, conserved [Eimeria maxima]|uniref:Uncharacterized protein n=1 Tax=Eimeria maxima TaxID=5804 RepID=U6M5T4_EIMMA|nr:hypothetical protein, conserved [Eimeria maxima]CDJ57015.1 hypothetical protein, conserved [Eimeria maxima]